MTTRIERLRELEEKVTPGEWKSCHAGGCPCGLIWNKKIDAVVACVPNECEFAGIGCDIVEKPEVRKATRELVVELRNALPALLKCVEAAQAFVKNNREHAYQGQCPDSIDPNGFDPECLACIEQKALRSALRDLEREGG